jgi:hypothetical protein
MSAYPVVTDWSRVVTQGLPTLGPHPSCAGVMETTEREYARLPGDGLNETAREHSVREQGAKCTEPTTRLVRSWRRSACASTSAAFVEQETIVPMKPTDAIGAGYPSVVIAMTLVVDHHDFVRRGRRRKARVYFGIDDCQTVAVSRDAGGAFEERARDDLFHRSAREITAQVYFCYLIQKNLRDVQASA